MTNSGTKLRTLHEDLYAWLPPQRGWGLANCGLLVGDDSALWIDTPYDRARAQEFLDSSLEVLPKGVEVEKIVVTHGNGDHFWGSGVLPRAEVITTREALEHMHSEPEPRHLDAMIKTSDAATPLGAYLREHFGVFDWADTERVRPTLLFRGELELRIGRHPVQVIGLPPAHTTGDLLVHLPRQRTVFAGDVVFGSTPEQPGDHAVHWAGPLSSVMAACERALATGAETIVPGHGPVLDRGGVEDHIRYLGYLQDRAQELHTKGVPALEAARRVISEWRYPQLALPERLAITIRTEYRYLSPAQQPSVVELLTDVAHIAADLAEYGGYDGRGGFCDPGDERTPTRYA